MRTFVDSAVRSNRGGHRSYQGLCVGASAAELAAAGRGETAATLVGWVRSVVGDYHGYALTARELDEAVVALPSTLGEQRHAELTAQGAAMDDDEILRFADTAVED